MDVSNFLEESSLAKIIKLPSRIVLDRPGLSPQDVMAIRKRGEYSPVPSKNGICEMEVNGEILAEGRIIKKRNGYYFKVLRINSIEVNDRSKPDNGKETEQ